MDGEAGVFGGFELNTYKLFLMNSHELMHEKNRNLNEIAQIHNLISQQASKHSVNELYGRLNFLTDRNLEIDNELNLLDYTNHKKSGNQMEKAYSISSAGGGVAIRPSDELSDPEEPKRRDHNKPSTGHKITIPSTL